MINEILLFKENELSSHLGMYVFQKKCKLKVDEVATGKRSDICGKILDFLSSYQMLKISQYQF